MSPEEKEVDELKARINDLEETVKKLVLQRHFGELTVCIADEKLFDERNCL
jgi:hypothetical protein